MEKINYPYIPAGREIKFVPLENSFMREAKDFAKKYSLDKTMPNAVVIVKENEIISRGANGSDYHNHHECERVKQNVPSGEGYELCEGCHPKNHGEQQAIRDAVDNKKETTGADVYLWGHWWCCESCWNAMMKAGIRDVYLLEGSEIFFNKNHSDNVVGRQFE